MHTSKKYLDENELINCKCGCGKEITFKNHYNWKGYPNYIHGHNNRNKKGELYNKNCGFKKRYVPLNKGKKCPQISNANKGRAIWNKGVTKETDERIMKSSERMFGNNNPMKDQKISMKVSKALTGKKYSMEEYPNKGTRGFVVPLEDTKIEVKIQNFLKELGIDFFTHQYINIKHKYRCDILIPSMNMVIETDGDYWHKYPIGTEIDHIRTKELIEKGFKVLRLWEREIKIMGIEDFKIKIQGVGDIQNGI